MILTLNLKTKTTKVFKSLWKGTKSTRRIKTERWHRNHQRTQRRRSSYTGVKDYLKERERQLYSTENHKHLQKDPIATNNELVHIVIKRFENEKVNPEIYRRTQKKPSANSSILHKS